ncbi:MAG TPA: hypothetical protein VFH78_14550, partial [Candidatus Thermoplasmatota archaeon]|nr:hypothetical protein [Candidatus Thermoplasmatota archaeon]
MSTGDFFAEHRKLIDSRKAHLARVGITPPEQAPLRDAMPSQADALSMPTTVDAPMLDATHPPALPKRPTRSYQAPKLPFDAPKA